MKNNQFILPAIINFDMVKLIFDLNPDIYEKSILKKNTLENITILSLMKDLYSDLGIPQSYVCMAVDMSRSANNINFRFIHHRSSNFTFNYTDVWIYCIPFI